MPLKRRPESTLQSKEPFEMTKLLEQAQGIMTQAGTTITGLQGTMTDVSRPPGHHSGYSHTAQ